MQGDRQITLAIPELRALERTDAKQPQVSQWEQAGSIRGPERPRLNRDGRAEHVLRTRPTDY